MNHLMRTRSVLILALHVAFVSVVGAHGGAQSQAPTFRAAADAVMVEVSVQAGNRPVTDLQIPDFTLLDKGVPQTIVDMTYGKLPIDVTVALDISFSVSGAMFERLQRAVGQLMRDLRPDDRLRLMMFNARVARVIDYSSDPAVIDAAMKSAIAGGGTSLHDAISLALVSSRAPGRRQLIVVFTDGSDASSTTPMSTLLDVASRTTATLSMVMPGGMTPTAGIFDSSFGFTGGVPVPPQTQVRRQLATVSAAYVGLSASTGGSVVPFRANEDLGAVFRRILDGFRSTYVLHFTPTGVERGGFHELQVTVSRPKTTVTARRGYFGG